MKIGHGNSTSIIRSLQRLNESIDVKCLEWHLVLTGCPVNVSKQEFCFKNPIMSFLQSLPLENKDLFS